MLCVKFIEKKFDCLIWIIWEEFECMYIFFKDYYYLDFVLDIIEIEVEGYLVIYYFLVIDLFKILIVVIDKRGREMESYDYVLVYDCWDLVLERWKKLFGEDDFYLEGYGLGINEFMLK